MAGRLWWTLKVVAEKGRCAKMDMNGQNLLEVVAKPAPEALISRYFRFNDEGTVSRVDRAGIIPLDNEFDVQIAFVIDITAICYNLLRNYVGHHDSSNCAEILAKRYECNDEPSFVRKIYIARDKSDEPRVNTHVAVLTYHWKSEPVTARANRDALIAKKRRSENPETADVEGRVHLGDNVAPLHMKRLKSAARLRSVGQILKPKELPTIDVLSRVRLSHADHLRRLALMKKSENLCRLASILDRAEPILERFEQVRLILTLNLTFSLFT
ncbi:hypothetical protein NECAME_11533 [Necator americanus]|uniref:Uncharacterized protein n=1 Tax=Necator americanus TaxID=51031 RepID=W2T622_NECAM|nr:hypothetical protein NECAME_11533 [Necator americanus]ETN76631.1 hypothetical protein NECAME_11533 [Necator americanus]